MSESRDFERLVEKPQTLEQTQVWTGNIQKDVEMVTRTRISKNVSSSVSSVVLSGESTSPLPLKLINLKQRKIQVQPPHSPITPKLTPAKVLASSHASRKSWKGGLAKTKPFHARACKRKEAEQEKPPEENRPPKKPRLVFTDIQRRTLHAIFKETKRPSKEMQATIAQQLGLEVSTVANFFMNARRRSLDKWQDDNGNNNRESASSCTKS
ncbi:hepatocyte nuclear factor 6-like isoform X5 [Haliotis cracherodii]|uniref:hepatocyte nuclear factor 6-like isoform X3 n=1 Tax=Haliotis rufescens TaxID=6454 RepID=UPI001EB01B80|nr:hepatocyte nuclear factor 6-like isoform X3 [Haliotis rufescens]